AHSSRLLQKFSVIGHRPSVISRKGSAPAEWAKSHCLTSQVLVDRAVSQLPGRNRRPRRRHGRSWVPLLRRAVNMKNFARLVRFAWPYRLRFGLSLVCALLVALLYGADIAAVYPLLKILFYNDNCQTWVAKEITLQEIEVRKIDSRLAEL